VAEPNSVVFAESTRKLVGNLFELQSLGAQELKGISGAVKVWTALRSASVESRFDALHASGLTELVGRKEELELLLRRWSKAKSGEGQVVLLSGEPGIGKSRLTAALLAHVAGEPHTRLRDFCSPQHTDSALYPIISQMERAAGFAHEDTSQQKLDKLDALLAQTSTPKHHAALFAEMLSLPNDGRHPTLELTPQQRREQTLKALTAQVEVLARSNPVLMIFEDAHWIDPTSLEVISRTVDRLRTLGLLLIVTYRPEFDPPWIGRPYVSALNLNRLGEREIVAMIERVAGNKPLSQSIRQDIMERTDGIPLFVEEMTKAVLEAQSEGAAESTITTIPSPSIGVPASLHASLMARLDRLGPAKEVAQIGATVGREFSYALLQALVRKPEAELRSALDRLLAAGLLFRQGIPPHASYLFKHALVQDAAYGTLLREPRRSLHARIVETLENEFTEIAESQPELLARHATEAGQIEKAASLWGKAGQRSLDRSALVEAATQITQALNQIAVLPGSRALRSQQIKLQNALITPLIHVKGYAAPETKVAIEQARLFIQRAEALEETPEDPLILFSVLYAFFAANIVGFKGDVVRQLAAQFLALAEKQGTTTPLLMAHRVMGISLLYTGGIAEARMHLEQATALYDPAEHRSLAMRFGGQDARAHVLSYLSWALWLLGYPEAALAASRRALSDAREIGQATTLMTTLTLATFSSIFCGDYATAKTQSDELILLADEKGGLYWKPLGIMNRGWLFTLTGKAPDAVELITSGIAAYRSTESTNFMPLRLSHLAIAYAEMGLANEAWRSVGEAMTTMETSKERWFEPEVNRIAGEIALKSRPPDIAKAKAYFDRSLTVARQQQAKSWELRASMSLARLWRDQSKPQQARELLAPVYGWFTEGFDTRDLKEAKALLEELAS
jgi:predicted ATPase